MFNKTEFSQKTEVNVLIIITIKNTNNT